MQVGDLERKYFCSMQRTSQFTPSHGDASSLVLVGCAQHFVRRSQETRYTDSNTPLIIRLFSKQHISSQIH